MAATPIIQVVSILLFVVGAWLVAFGLKIRLPGDVSEREIEEKQLTTTVGMTQKRVMVWWGLGLITFAGVLQITISVEYLYLLVRPHTVMLDNTGLILDIVGVLLIARFGLPTLFVNGTVAEAIAFSTAGTSPDKAKAEAEKKTKRYKTFSHVGIALIVAGFAFQMLANIV
jgi:hypothetical protein